LDASLIRHYIRFVFAHAKFVMTSPDCILLLHKPNQEFAVMQRRSGVPPENSRKPLGSHRTTRFVERIPPTPARMMRPCHAQLLFEQRIDFLQE
jgi:hypothetical protein